MIYSLLISNKLLDYDPIIKKRKLFELIFLKEFCIIKWRCYNWKTFCFSCHIKIIELLKARTRIKSRDKNFYLELRWVLSIMRRFITLCWELVYNGKLYWVISFFRRVFYDNFSLQIGSWCSWSSFPRLRRQWTG